METENSNFLKPSLLEKDVNLAVFHRRRKKLTLLFKFFFISLTLIIAALFIYLVQDITSDLDQSTPSPNPTTNQTFNPVNSTDSHVLDNLSLQTAAKELEDITSSILYNYLGSNIDATTEFALKKCWRSLQNGSAQIRDALDNEQSVEIMNLVKTRVEESVKSCLDDLEKVESTAGIEVREKVLRAQVHLRGGGDFLMSYGESIWEKVSSTVAAGWDSVCLFIVCVGALQSLFIFYLLWALIKFR